MNQLMNEQILQISNHTKNQVNNQTYFMDEFFTEGEYAQSQQPVVYTQHADTQQNQWDQAEVYSNAFQSSPSYNMDSQLGYSSNIVTNIGSSTAIDVDSEVTRKIAEEEDKINEILREKSNQEYEEKQARKAAGREQLDRFFAQKEKELGERKLLNAEHEQKVVERAKELTQKAGWGKVFENVQLKQGEHQGTKSINRMRESIINKYEDKRQQN